MADDKKTESDNDYKPSYYYDDKVQSVGFCSVCGHNIMRDDESPVNAGMHKECDSDYDDDDDDDDDDKENDDDDDDDDD